MLKELHVWCCASLLLMTTPSPTDGAHRQDHPTDRAGWWIKNRGLLDENEDPRVRRALNVFERVAAAADRRASRLPRFLAVQGGGKPFAIALPDGTVVLSEGALDICYRGVSPEDGDARLAFVLGHELAHLSNDDFWHATAFEAYERARREHEAPEGVLDAIVPADARSAELQADDYGMLYMAAAGYDPRKLLAGKNFFREWTEQMERLGIYLRRTHPSPEERVSFVRAQLESVADELEFFSFGVRLFQIGRYQDAILLLERFRDRFPSREVLNNIGASHYQLAANILGMCDASRVTRFKLPLVLDPETRARRLRSGARSSTCFERDDFRHHYGEAERNFALAAEHDPNYLPARLNLLSLYALAEEGAKAYVAAQEASEISPDDPRVLYGSAVALYIFGQQSGAATADTAIQQLRDLRESFPDLSEVAYNLAAILAERRRVQSAKAVYRSFLELERSGLHAEAAWEYLDELGVKPDERRGAWETPDPPIPLGPVEPDLTSHYPGAVQKRVETSGFQGRVIYFEGFKAYAIDSVIEVIEQPLSNRESVASMLSRYGDPSERIATPKGPILLYPNFGLETSTEGVETLLFFSPLPGRR